MITRLSSGAEGLRPQTAWHEESMPTANVPDSAAEWAGESECIA